MLVTHERQTKQPSVLTITFQCENCNRTFTSRESLWMHVGYRHRLTTCPSVITATRPLPPGRAYWCMSIAGIGQMVGPSVKTVTGLLPPWQFCGCIQWVSIWLTTCPNVMTVTGLLNPGRTPGIHFKKTHQTDNVKYPKNSAWSWFSRRISWNAGSLSVI